MKKYPLCIDSRCNIAKTVLIPKLVIDPTKMFVKCWILCKNSYICFKVHGEILATQNCKINKKIFLIKNKPEEFAFPSL